ncbi:sensor histidine kinase [Halobacillus campisalis]|uniref:histidine kinase n=1 Tax=Halobacillus campisalis TaxID=435909 RepID=A0ABW2K3X5_9BACI|nr:HAMP domain-containing sensor histidine kinase [Halobacillus campisalis]
MGKLKIRLIIAFLSIIFLPVAITGASLAIQSSQLERQDETVSESYQQMEEWLREQLSNHEFAEINIEEAVERFSTDVKIMYDEGETIYQSSNHISDEESSAVSLPPDEFEVTSAEGYLYNVEMRSQANLTKNILQSILISVGLGAASLLTLIIVWTWYISRTILMPLREIYRATEEVMEGNLDYHLSYKKKDEIGRFIKGFNAMRLHLKELKEEQKQYEASRKQLIASVSHDLRTPLSSIKGYVEGLEDGVADTKEKREKYYQVIRRKTDQLDRLIEDLFQFSKVELQKLPIQQELIDSQVFLQDVLEEFEMEAEKKGVELSYDKPLPTVTLSIDPERIVQVITNLIDNAVRYGTKHLDIEAVVSEEGTFQLAVHDDGSGIEADEIESIFNQFYRGEKSRSRELGGSGLGLSIAQSIIQQHGGRLSAQSEPEKGSTFTIELPLLLEQK